MDDVKQMTVTQLKQYLSQHRRDDRRFSEALSELLSRDRNPTIYPPQMAFEDIDRAWRAKMENDRRQETTDSV